jgi:hypothetical protein
VSGVVSGLIDPGLPNPASMWSDHDGHTMDQIRIPITALRDGVTLPAYQSSGAAGMDVEAALDGLASSVSCRAALRLPSRPDTKRRCGPARDSRPNTV